MCPPPPEVHKKADSIEPAKTMAFVHGLLLNVTSLQGIDGSDVIIFIRET